MKIELTDEQMNQALQEGWCEITHASGFRIFCEIGSEGGFQYGEYYPPGWQIATVTRGRTKGEMTLWYECDACGETVDKNDNYYSNCGRKLKHE